MKKFEVYEKLFLFNGAILEEQDEDWNLLDTVYAETKEQAITKAANDRYLAIKIVNNSDPQSRYHVEAIFKAEECFPKPKY